MYIRYRGFAHISYTEKKMIMSGAFPLMPQGDNRNKAGLSPALFPSKQN
jgi:hypothetical protein